jgi:hypothetical protein
MAAENADVRKRILATRRSACALRRVGRAVGVINSSPRNEARQLRQKWVRDKAGVTACRSAAETLMRCSELVFCAINRGSPWATLRRLPARQPWPINLGDPNVGQIVGADPGSDPRHQQLTQGRCPDRRGRWQRRSLQAIRDRQYAMRHLASSSYFSRATAQKGAAVQFLCRSCAQQR